MVGVHKIVKDSAMLFPKMYNNSLEEEGEESKALGEEHPNLASGKELTFGILLALIAGTQLSKRGTFSRSRWCGADFLARVGNCNLGSTEVLITASVPYAVKFTFVENQLMKTTTKEGGVRQSDPIYDTIWKVEQGVNTNGLLQKGSVFQAQSFKTTMERLSRESRTWGSHPQDTQFEDAGICEIVSWNNHEWIPITALYSGQAWIEAAKSFEKHGVQNMDGFFKGLDLLGYMNNYPDVYVNFSHYLFGFAKIGDCNSAGFPQEFIFLRNGDFKL